MEMNFIFNLSNVEKLENGELCFHDTSSLVPFPELASALLEISDLLISDPDRFIDSVLSVSQPFILNSSVNQLFLCWTDLSLYLYYEKFKSDRMALVFSMFADLGLDPAFFKDGENNEVSESV